MPVGPRAFSLLRFRPQQSPNRLLINRRRDLLWGLSLYSEKRMATEIPVYCGFDRRESVAFHVFCHSVMARTKAQISFTPVSGTQDDASTTFSKARFLVPQLNGHHGWAIFADGDMLCRADIEELWELRDNRFDVMVVKHDYRTKHSTKFLGQRNEDYPCKNWSSVVLWNCGNAVWRRPAYRDLLRGPAGLLHRFSFLEDERIGEIPVEWNWLSVEYDYNPDAKLVHHTLGVPCWEPYATIDPYAQEWRNELRSVNYFEPWTPEDQTPQLEAITIGGRSTV